MAVFGDDAAGYSIEVPTADTVEVFGWGFWSVELSSGFDAQVLNACSVKPRGAVLVIHMTRLKPMREQGQAAFGRVFDSLTELGLTTSIVTANALTKLQLMRLARESGVASSIEWVNEESEFGRNT